MTDTKNTVSDADWLEEAARYFENRDTGGEDMAFWANVSNAERCRSIAQSLRAPMPGGVRVKPMEWTIERRSGFNIHVGRGLGLKYEAAIKAYNPGWIVTCGTVVVFDGSEADEEEAKAAAQADYERRTLSVLDLSPAEGEPVGLFRKTGGAWKQVPDEWADHPNVQPLYAAPSNPVISDDLVHAAQFLIERLDDFENGSLGDSIEDACRDFDGHISPAIERLRAALTADLSVKPQSDK